MRIALIYPNRYAKYNVKEREFYRVPPYNLLVLAGLTPRDFEIEIIDERYEKINFDKKYDLVGITALTCNAPRAYEIASEFRHRGVKVILGGIHPTFLPYEAIKYADSVVLGEAESIWREVLQDAQRGKLRKFYKGKLCDLKDTPFPRWDLLKKLKRYVFFVQATRGCPNNCKFCSVPKFSGRRLRVKPIEKIVEEIKKFGKKFVIFVDDNIFARKEYAFKLFKALKSLRIKWGGEASINTLCNFDLIKEAAKSGCKALFVGLETIKQKSLEFLNKTFNALIDFKKLVEVLHRNGIAVIASMMFGLDHDDAGIFRRTVNFLDEAKVDAAIFSILTPLPGTDLFEQFQKEGRILHYDWSKYDALHCVFKPKRMTKEQLENGLKFVYREFYSPLRVLKRIPRMLKVCPFMIPVNIGYMIGARRGICPDWRKKIPR